MAKDVACVVAGVVDVIHVVEMVIELASHAKVLVSFVITCY